MAIPAGFLPAFSILSTLSLRLQATLGLPTDDALFPDVAQRNAAQDDGFIQRFPAVFCWDINPILCSDPCGYGDVSIRNSGEPKI